MSASTFARACRRAGYANAMDFLDTQRLEHARELLATGGWKLSAIARDCGFAIRQADADFFGVRTHPGFDSAIRLLIFHIQVDRRTDPTSAERPIMAGSSAKRSINLYVKAE